MRTTSATPVEALTGSIRVLIAEDNQYLRKLIRNLLVNVGIKKIDEVTDGLAGFEAIKSLDPDIVIIDWELPLLNGVELVRIMPHPRHAGAAGHADHHVRRLGRALAHRGGETARR